MEPASHRLDREAMLADRVAVAERIRRDVDEAVVAATEKRRAHIDRIVENLRFAAREQPAAAARATSADGEAARRLVAPARAADNVRETSGALVLRTLTEERELSARVHAQTESERAALAEMQERLRQAERDAEELLVETVRVEAEMQERRKQAEREAEEILARARVEAGGVVSRIEEERRVQVAREAEEILARTQAEADRVAAEIEERRVRVERESDEIHARALEAERIVATTEEQRHRVRELLSGVLASLGDEAAAPSESLVGDLSSRPRETTEPTVT